MNAWWWALAQLTRRIWLKASIYALVGAAAALLAAIFSSFVPKALAEPFGGGTVDGLLNILASSLLTVATFSATAVLTAYMGVTSTVTPRAAALITSDSRAQTALSSFVGGFLYSIVAYSALGTGYYAHGGRAILFATTLIMMIWISITLLRWLDHLTAMARMGKVIERVEDATRHALVGPFGARLDQSCWTEPPADAQPVAAQRVGYVRNVDLGALYRLAGKLGCEIWVLATPGKLVHDDCPVVLVRSPDPLSSKQQAALHAAFDISGARTFDQDPRFGFVVLAEIASRALSPAVNDPGTAVDVIGAAIRLLTLWRTHAAQAHRSAPGVHLQPHAYVDLLDDVLRPIASDGASNLIVMVRLQKAYAALHAEARKSPAMQADLSVAAADALERALAQLSNEGDKTKVYSVHQTLKRGADLASVQSTSC